MANLFADFDAIYEDNGIEEVPDDSHATFLVPDPIIIRGAGNMTV